MDELSANPPPIPEPPDHGRIPPTPPAPPTPPPPPTPRPLPWEQPGYPLFAALYETTKLLLTSPAEAFERSSPNAGIGRPLLYGCILSFIGNFFTAVYQFCFKTIAQSMPPHGGMHDWMGGEWAIPPFAQMLATILVSPFLIPLGILLSAFIVHVFLLILGGGDGDYADTLKAECYSNAPLFLSIVPLCGSLVGIIWALILLVIGLSVVHRISTGKAIAAVILPLLLCCACLLPILFFAGLHHLMR
jgi:hypothetical protein